MLPSVPDVSKNGGKRDDLRLVRQIKNPIDVKHVQELRGLHETPLNLRFILLVRIKRQIKQCLTVS